MIGNFLNCRAFLKRPRIEGGKIDDPEDPGGRTNEGIEQREYSSWLHLHNQPDVDVFNASEATLTEIFRVQYWSPYCDHLPLGVDLVYFDTSVVQGVSYAVTCLQHALQIETDGHFGLVTASACKSIGLQVGSRPAISAATVIAHMTAQRKMMRFRSTRKFARYGDGWLYRADDCQKVALLMEKCDGVDAAAKVVSQP